MAFSEYLQKFPSKKLKSPKVPISFQTLYFTNKCSNIKTMSDTPLPMPRIIKAENVIIPYMYMYMYKYDFKLQQNGNEDLRK